MLCGDFNARIACENDFIINDDSRFTPLYDNYISHKDKLKRQHMDKVKMKN